MSEGPIGEIIEAGTTGFVAQCLELPRGGAPKLFDPPAFGSFVKVSGAPTPAPEAEPAHSLILTAATEEEADPFAPSARMFEERPGNPVVLPAATYALVYDACTTSLETGRRPSALGFADEEEIRAQQPQIFELLRTEFSALLVGYSDGDAKGLRRHLPPKPPRIHGRVYPCEANEVRVLTEDLSFLRAVLLPSGGALAGAPCDELAAACLRQAWGAHGGDREFLLRAGKALAAILTDDYDRLQAILRSIL